MSIAEAAFGGLMIWMGLRKLGGALSDLKGSVDDVHKKTGKYAQRPCPGDGKGGMRCKLTEGGSIERRARIIADKIKKDSLDPRIRKIAMHALTERCGDAWCTPPRDGKAEIGKLHADLKNPSSPLSKGIRGIEGIFHYVRRNVRYTKDHATVDTFQSAYRTLEDFHGGDCDDFTGALGALLRSVGYPVKLRIYWLTGESEPGHIALLANADPRKNAWMVLDASVDNVSEGGRMRPVHPGWEASKRQVAKHKDFEV